MENGNPLGGAIMHVADIIILQRKVVYNCHLNRKIGMKAIEEFFKCLGYFQCRESVGGGWGQVQGRGTQMHSNRLQT